MDIKELKRLAETATPGPWSDNGGYAGVQDSDGNTIANVYGESRKLTIATTEYIIAANPAVILELLREREELLAVVKDAGFLLDMLRTGENGEQYDYVNSRHKSMMLVGNVIDDALNVIAKAESAS